MESSLVFEAVCEGLPSTKSDLAPRMTRVWVNLPGVLQGKADAVARLLTALHGCGIDTPESALAICVSAGAGRYRCFPVKLVMGTAGLIGSSRDDAHSFKAQHGSVDSGVYLMPSSAHAQGLNNALD